MGISHNMQCILWFTMPPLLKCFILIGSYQISLNKLGFSSSVTPCFPHTEQRTQNILFWFPLSCSHRIRRSMKIPRVVMTKQAEKWRGKRSRGLWISSYFMTVLSHSKGKSQNLNHIYFPITYFCNICKLDIIWKLLKIHPVQTGMKSDICVTMEVVLKNIFDNWWLMNHFSMFFHFIFNPWELELDCLFGANYKLSYQICNFIIKIHYRKCRSMYEMIIWYVINIYI